jgi:hypothetical protein
MAGNQGGGKPKKQLFRCIETRSSIAKLMRGPSLYTAVRRSFSIFHCPEFSLHLHALLRRAVCIAGQPVAKSHTRASTSGA